ncbi:TPA: hypothetical protein I8W54_003262 [Morganella morganii]|nr:hypothetical protein [Morganella morganii]
MKKIVISALASLIFPITSLAGELPALTDSELVALHTVLERDTDISLAGGESLYDYGFIQVTAKEMQKIYAANEVKGDRTFKGKKLVIEGVVESIKSGVNDVPVVSLVTDDKIRSVNLEFSKKYEDIAVDLIKGLPVYYACVGGTVVMGFPSVEECAPLDNVSKELANEKLREIRGELASGALSGDVTPKVLTAVKIFTKATNNYQTCKPDDLDCLVKAKDKYMAQPGAKEEAKAILDSYTVK